MKVELTIYQEGSITKCEAQAGEPVGPLLRERGLLALPCGIGKCGKCLIYVDPPCEPCQEERTLLGERALTEGLRLACYTRAAEGMSIRIPRTAHLRVLMDFSRSAYEFSPLVKACPIELAEATLEDQTGDLERLMEACGASEHRLSLRQLAALPSFLRENGPVTAHLWKDTLVGCGREEKLHALVVDIGTTTVAAMLVDLKQGRPVAIRGEANAQASYGADVISRIHQQIQWIEAGQKGDDPLHQAVCAQINSLLEALLAEAGLADVDCIAIAGNTTMMHFLCGLPAGNIAFAPFIPVLLKEQVRPAQEVGIRSAAPVFMLPGISAYIGADIVGSLLAADAHHPQPPFLLLDLGTNAETVLGHGDTLYACSAAAGPCFEGATLSCGMAGQDGAVDTVFKTESGELGFSTLGNIPPRGICGSGILDTVALLLDEGLVDETGRLCADDTPIGRLIRDDALELAPGVKVTQKDIREVQLAKAAVRAGIDILLQEAELEVNDVACLYLAGGFGSALNTASAARIGLIPQELASRVRVLGNGASSGALRYITEDGAFERAADLVKRTKYLELSAHSAFSDAYIQQIMFPES